MKAVILAAGRGTRMGELTLDRPKCLLPIRNRCTIDYAIENLVNAGIAKYNIAIVVGFKKEMIIQHVGDTCVYIENPEFSHTNDMYSFGLTRDFVGNSDCVFLHADVFFDPTILRDCVSYEPLKNVLVVDTDNWTEESMKVEVKNGIVVRSSKALKPENTYGDWIGMAKFAGESIHHIFDTIEYQVELGESDTHMGVACFTPMAQAGHKFYSMPTNNRPWIEADFDFELEKANSSIYDLIYRGV